MTQLLDLLLLVTLGSGGTAGGGVPEWGGFRGNNGTGLSACVGLPDALDPDENLIWRTDVPAGYSSPIVAGKDVFLTGCTATKLVTLCIDAYSGEIRWQKELDYNGKKPGQNSSAAPTPAADGERVIVLFHHVGLVAYDREGKELWKQPIGPFNIPHGMASSPVIHGDLVLLQVDQDPIRAASDGSPAVSAYLVAYDKRTGEQRWRIARPGVAQGYATPAVYEPANGPAQLVVSSSFQVAGYALSNGEKLWWLDGAGWQTKSVPVFAGERCFVNSFMPAISDMGMTGVSGTFAETLAQHDADKDGKISQGEYGDEVLHMIWAIFDQNRDGFLDEGDWKFALSANDARGGLFAVTMGGKGDVSKSNLAWRCDDRRGLSDTTSPVIVDGTLFVISNGSLLTSFDVASGKVIKQERVADPDDYYASPVVGDGKLYLASAAGLLTVVRAKGPWEVLSTHTLPDDKVWSTPALAGHAVYVRSERALYCFEKPQ